MEEKSERIDISIDRSAFSVVSLDEADDDLAYWLSKTPQERFEGIEAIRQILYGYDHATARLQRFFEIAELD